MTGLVRGNYRCRLCGGMKKKHNCPMLHDSAKKGDIGTEVSWQWEEQGRVGSSAAAAPLAGSKD